ncbi:hypothetical protein [Winogradskyella sp. PC D3.3]
MKHSFSISYKKNINKAAILVAYFNALKTKVTLELVTAITEENIRTVAKILS